MSAGDGDKTNGLAGLVFDRDTTGFSRTFGTERLCLWNMVRDRDAFATLVFFLLNITRGGFTYI
jgi:hypothetical protein